MAKSPLTTHKPEFQLLSHYPEALPPFPPGSKRSKRQVAGYSEDVADLKVPVQAESSPPLPTDGPGQVSNLSDLQGPRCATAGRPR